MEAKQEHLGIGISPQLQVTLISNVRDISSYETMYEIIAYEATIDLSQQQAFSRESNKRRQEYKTIPNASSTNTNKHFFS